MMIQPSQFKNVEEWILSHLARSEDVDVGEWQAIRNAEMPQATTLEVEDVSFSIVIPQSVTELQSTVGPNLPWAEEHFQERVSGIPFNPPPSHVRWPFAQKSNSEHMANEEFSHTYPERMWPQWAGDSSYGEDGYPVANRGIRYNYGDLNDVVALLRDHPGTRQAYLPIWFPEDTGAVEGQRVPCTLGYHFLLRGGRLKIVYYIRSCDFYRHFRDDVYMAARLCQWVAEQIGARPGNLVMHTSSMHVFAAERNRVKEDLAVIRYKESSVVTPTR